MVLYSGKVGFIIIIILWLIMAFDLHRFLVAPSHGELELCRKADLLEVAGHFGLSLSRSLIKQEMRLALLTMLVELGVLEPEPDIADGESRGTLDSGVGAVEDPLKLRASLFLRRIDLPLRYLNSIRSHLPLQRHLPLLRI